MQTIQIGIDLGTTNSSVAIIQDGEVQILKNALGEESTPSIVFADRNGNVVVGSKAKRVMNSSKANQQNSKAEIKRLMGTSETIFFPHLDKEMMPEEISAEVLKSLREDIQRKNPNIPLDAAVITVPAYFSTVQSEATKRAGNISGFKQVILIQEPIAAAIAYGFLNQKNGNWLVYDLGGGTFDVALVAIRDGSLTVLAHNGDNFLGGKDFDEAIIANLLVPFLSKKGLNTSSSNDPQVLSKLKELAELAKIELTSSNKTTIDIDLEIKDKHIQESLEISRSDLLKCCQHLLKRTVDLCKSTIADSQVDENTIKKIVLVGGPTQMPILREYLKKTLKTQVDGSLDPLTVVARGAAMFGAQTTIETKKTKVTSNNKNNKKAAKSSKQADCQLEINYCPVISEDDQVVTGKILNQTTNIHSIQFVNSDDTFATKEFLIKNNKFIVTLPTGDKASSYWIYVKDKKGKLISSSPESIDITRGVTIMGAPLPYSIGVSVVSLSSQKGYAEASETMDFFFEKNSILPLKKTTTFTTVSDVKGRSSDNALPICIYEGESPNPTRNTRVCLLEITGKMISKDLKKGSPVELTIEINESRELSAIAYLPSVDMTINARATLYFDEVQMDQVKRDLDEQESRSKVILSSSPEKSGVESVKEMINNIKSTIASCGTDSDKQRKAEKQMKDLMIALDQMEATTKFDKNTSNFWKLSQEIADYLEDCNPPQKRQEYEAVFSTLRKEGITAIENQDAIWLQHIIEKLDSFHTKCLFADPKVLSVWIRDLISENIDKNRSNPDFIELVHKSEAALRKQNVEEMQEVARSLFPFCAKKETPLQLFIKSGITNL